MKVRVPASSANLGPGFDVLAVALTKYLEVEVKPANKLTIVSHGEGSDLPADETHLAARVVEKVFGHTNTRVTISSTIPLARGLGSSAALALGVAAACGAADPLAVAIDFEGHGENAAASFYGGLVAVASLAGNVALRRLSLDPGLSFVLLIPDKELTTAEARSVLPETITRQDAIFNLGRLAMLIAGFADVTLLSREACEDRLHQNYRAKLFPEADDLMNRLIEGGALAACWSGAGSAILGICAKDAVEAVRDKGGEAMAAAGLNGKAEILSADTEGMTFLKE